MRSDLLGRGRQHVTEIVLIPRAYGAGIGELYKVRFEHKTGSFSMARARRPLPPRALEVALTPKAHPKQIAFSPDNNAWRLIWCRQA